MKQNLSVIIPTLNSSKFIAESISKLSQFLKNSKQVNNYEITLVVQRSDDNTLDILTNIKKKNQKINLIYLEQRGKGRAVTRGIKSSKYPFLFMIDDDMPYKLSFIDDALKLSDKYDLIIASRYCKKMFNNAPKSRKIASFCYRTMVRAMFFIPQKDIQAGSKIMKKEIFTKIPFPKEKRYVWDTELLHLANEAKLKIKELPFSLKQKPNFLKIHKTLFEMFWDVLLLRLRTL